MNKNFDYLGNTFQLQLINQIIEDKDFASSIIDVIESSYFDNKYFKIILQMTKEYHAKYQSTPNFDILEQIVNDISETNSIKFRVENKNLPLNCIFRLQIEYLGHIIPKVYDEFARDVEIFVTLNVTQIQLKMNGNNLIGELNLEYNIYSKEKLLLSYNILYDFGLLPIYQNQLFDLILNGLKIKDTTVVYNPYGMLDEENLRTYSSDSLNNYLQENPFYLFRQHLDFNTIFDNSKLIVVENEGIVIGGNRNNFSTSGSTKNVKRMIISMIKKQLN